MPDNIELKCMIRCVDLSLCIGPISENCYLKIASCCVSNELIAYMPAISINNMCMLLPFKLKPLAITQNQITVLSELLFVSQLKTTTKRHHDGHIGSARI